MTLNGPNYKIKVCGLFNIMWANFSIHLTCKFPYCHILYLTERCDLRVFNLKIRVD